MLACSEINELMLKGKLTRDHAGHIVHANGSPIRCVGNETFVEAYNRESGVVSNFIGVIDESDSEQELRMDSESESVWQDEVFAVRDVGQNVYGVERPEKQITAKR